MTFFASLFGRPVLCIQAKDAVHVEADQANAAIRHPCLVKGDRSVTLPWHFEGSLATAWSPSSAASKPSAGVVSRLGSVDFALRRIQTQGLLGW